MPHASSPSLRLIGSSAVPETKTSQSTADDETLRGLANLLAGADRLVYAIAADRKIVYANAAVAEWLGIEADNVLGRAVAYHSADGAETGSLLTGLCPPPEAFAGAKRASTEVTGTISCVARAGGLRHRRIRCLPLGEDAVLVIGEAQDLTADEIASRVAGTSPNSLRLAIQRFRAEQAAKTAPALLGRSPATQQLRRQFNAVAAAGCNALVTGGDEQQRRSLAESLHHAASDQSKTSSTLLPIDYAITGADEAHEQIATACARRPATLLLIATELLDEDQQVAIARRLQTIQPTRVLAVVGDTAKLGNELHQLVATVTLRIPPLTERAADLPLLFQWFVEQQNARGEKQRGGLTESAIELLAAYPFRDLSQIEKMIATAHQQCRGPLIDRGDLPRAVEQAALAAELSSTSESVDLDQLLADVEREVVTRALATAQDNKAEAARLLGLTRQRFYRLLERLGLLDTEQGGAS